MAFFMQNKHTAIGHISRVHGYKGKIVISLNNPNQITLNEDHTVWINTDGIESPFKIQNVQNGYVRPVAWRGINSSEFNWRKS